MLIPAAEPISSGCATSCSLASATRNAGRYERAARWIQDGIAAVPESFQVERILVTAAARTSALLSTAAMHIPLPSWVICDPSIRFWLPVHVCFAPKTDLRPDRIEIGYSPVIQASKLGASNHAL